MILTSPACTRAGRGRDMGRKSGNGETLRHSDSCRTLTWPGSFFLECLISSEMASSGADTEGQPAKVFCIPGRPAPFNQCFFQQRQSWTPWARNCTEDLLMSSTLPAMGNSWHLLVEETETQRGLICCSKSNGD